MENKFILQMEGISKFFPGVRALSDVKLNVKKGTVHALVGENGAGKSTLIKILTGLYKPDAGRIIYKGKEVEIDNIQKALELGISVIHQELSTVLDMRVCDNIFLGREIKHKNISLIVDDKIMIQATQNLMDEMGIAGISPTTVMRELSVSKMQMVEIIKAVSYEADLIVMDEPTSAISQQEVEILFQTIDKLKKVRNVSFIYITHKIDELYRITDEITVFRDGKYVGSGLTSEISKDQLFAMMVNRDLGDYYVHTKKTIGDVCFEVKNLASVPAFEDISFKLHRGEILGIYGLMGAGRTELVETLFGLRKIDGGEIHKDGKKIAIKNVRDAIRNKIAMVTEDRKRYGLFLGMSVKANITVCYLKNLLNMIKMINRKSEEQVAEQSINALQIKTPTMEQLAMNLSGGNQQKIVVSKWLLMNPDILILDEPTRGIDVGAKSEIYGIMNKLASEGMAIIMISSEMPEVVGMSDRIIVIRGGRLTGEFTREQQTPDKLIRSATE